MGDGNVPIPQPDPGTVLGDFDGDSRIDFLQWTLNADCRQLTTRTVLASSTAGVWGDDSNEWIASGPDAVTGCVPATSATGLFPADLDGDSRTDLLFFQQRRVAPLDPSNQRYLGSVVAALSNGDTTFAVFAPVSLWTSADKDEMAKARCAVGDLNGDARDDVVCLAPQDGVWNVVEGISDGRGHFLVLSSTAPAYVNDQLRLAAGDVNGDGKADVVIVNPSTPSGLIDIAVGISRDDGTLLWRRQSTSVHGPASGDKTRFLTGDFNGDRQRDGLVVISSADGSTGTLILFMSTGGASASYAVTSHTVAGGMPAISVGDVDGDGTDDILFAIRRPATDSSCGYTRLYDSVEYTWVRSVNGVLNVPQHLDGCYTATGWPSPGDWTNPSTLRLRT